MSFQSLFDSLFDSIGIAIGVFVAFATFDQALAQQSPQEWISTPTEVSREGSLLGIHKDVDSGPQLELLDPELLRRLPDLDESVKRLPTPEQPARLSDEPIIQLCSPAAQITNATNATNATKGARGAREGPQGFQTTSLSASLPRFLADIGNQRLLANAQELRWSLDDVIMAALAYSHRVSGMRIQAVEELQNVGIEFGRFDTVGFLEQSFRDSSEPVGNSIDVAMAQAAINEEDYNFNYGIRKQLLSGGSLEIGKSFQLLDNDSGILVPPDQAISRWNAQLTKELLRGSGRSVAMNQVLVASHNASARRSESVAGIADHLTEVMTAYWDIFAARGALLASMENRQLAIQVFEELKSRDEIDAEQNLLSQSLATIGQRELQIINARNDLARAQIQLISLVNAPELLHLSHNLEILPQVQLDLISRNVDVSSRVNTAIQRRPEIGNIVEQIQAGRAENHLTLNELLPRLSLSLESSLNGLDGDRDVGGAFANQFDNRVTYGVGINLEFPLRNRQARYNNRRTELGVARLQAEWQQLIEQVKAEVLDSAQVFSASQARLELQQQVLQYSTSELAYLQIRKDLAPKESDNPSFALTQVLAAQDRQGQARAELAGAIADKQRAIFELNRATGILVNTDVIPTDGGPGKSGLFAVYHQLIEQTPEFDARAAELRNYVRENSRSCRRRAR